MAGLLNILQLEDDPNDVYLMQRALSGAGQPAQIQSVKDGDEGRRYLSGEGDYRDRGRFPLPHLVLLDLKMPRMDGYEFLKWVKKEPSWRYLPIIIWSSSAEQQDVELCYRLGAASYVVKSVDLQDLILRVGLILRYWSSCSHAATPVAG